MNQMDVIMHKRQGKSRYLLISNSLKTYISRLCTVHDDIKQEISCKPPCPLSSNWYLNLGSAGNTSITWEALLITWLAITTIWLCTSSTSTNDVALINGVSVVFFCK